MIDFLFYSAKTIGIQLLFLIAYQIFLSKETFFNANRFYLIGSFIASLVIPFIEIQNNSNRTSEDTIINLKSILVMIEENKLKEISPNTNTLHNLKTIIFSIEIVYIVGLIVFCVLLYYKLKGIKARIDNSKIELHNGVKVYRIQQSNEAFSFLNFIFIGQNNTALSIVLQHELTHKNKWHSVDLFLLEIAKTIFWFNPLLYLYQNKLAEVHEFEADAIAVKKDKIKYFESLINQVFQVEKIAFTNNFFNQSLIKKRIVMLQKTKSKKIELLKYALAIPMLFLSVLFFSNCSDNKTNEVQVVYKPNGNTNDDDNQITESLSINSIEEIPRFKECEDVDAKDAMECFNEQMMHHIKTNFIYPDKAAEDDVQGRVNVQFVIDKYGNVTDIKTRGPVNGELLEKEAMRIVSLLPQFTPGKIDGKPVNVKYGLPITFKLQ